MRNDWTAYLPLVVIVLLVLRRAGRARTLEPSRLWILPSVFMALALFYAWGAYRAGPHLGIADDAIIAGCAALGIAIGYVRAHTMKLDRHPDTGKIQSTLTLWGVAFLLLWLGGRTGLRLMGFTGASVPFGVFNDAMFALAVSSVVARTFVITRRCRELPSPAANAPDDQKSLMS
jgi:hypothetical protein